MKLKTFAGMAFVAAFLITGCKSEADKVVHKACSVDLSKEENQDNCVKAIKEYCGESSREAVRIQKNIWGLESFRILNALNKGDPEKGARIKEDQKKLEEKWDKLALSSTYKDAVEDLFEAEYKEKLEEMAEKGKKAAQKNVKRETEGFISSIVDKIKSFFSSSPEETEPKEELPTAAVNESPKKEERTSAAIKKTEPKEEEPSATTQKTGFHDSRDGKTYRTMDFNGKTWMAENLNFAVNGSSCYENQPENCEKYGRLYTWDQAMAACPKGWRLPNNADFEQIKNSMEQEFGTRRAGAGLKSRGFMSVFAGDRFKEKYQLIDESNYLWSADDEGERAYDWVATTSSDDFFMGNIKFALKTNGMSVRCIQD